MKHFVLTQMMLLMSVATIMGQEPVIPTPPPEILCEYYDSYAAIWVEGVGELHLYCNEEEVENPYYVDYVYGEQNLFFTATAQAEGYPISDMAIKEITIPAIEVLPITATPSINVEISHSTAMLIIYDEDPEATLYYRVSYSNDNGFGDWSEWIESFGWVYFTDQGYYLIEAYAISPGKLQSEIVCTSFELNTRYKTVPPLVYAHHVDPEKGLALRIVDGRIGENPFKPSYMDDVYYHYSDDWDLYEAPADSFFYRVNNAGEWVPSQEYIYLKDYGDYTISAYACNDDAADSEIITATVEYGPTGHTSQSGSYIVNDGIVYDITGDSTLKVSTCYFNGMLFINYPLITPDAPSIHVNIPPTIQSRGQDYKVTSLGANGVKGSVTIPSTINHIELPGYDYFWSLDSVTIDEGNPVYDSRENCNAVIRTADNTLIIGGKNTVIPSTVTCIGRFAFYMVAIPQIVIPNSVKTIGSMAFGSCECLKNVTIGNSVDTIGYEAFGGCESIERIITHAIIPPVANTLFYYDEPYGQVTLFVPNESLEDYKAHEEWGKFTHIVPFIGAGPGDINGDGNIAISDATELVDMLLNGDELPAWGDVNGDGNVTVLDVTDLIDLLMNNN